MSLEAWAASTAVVAAVGLLDALYFTLVAYRWIRPDPRWLPPMCRMDQASCARIVDTREGRLLGVPNGLVGLVYYALVLVAALHAASTGRWSGCETLVGTSAVALAVSLYLAWALVARLRVVCALCFLGHAINVALLLLLIRGCTL